MAARTKTIKPAPAERPATKRDELIAAIAAKERGEEPQTWKDWAAEQKVHRVNFPGYVSCNHYMRQLAS